jgi:UDP-glucose 6-dehydrogenase
VGDKLVELNTDLLQAEFDRARASMEFDAREVVRTADMVAKDPRIGKYGSIYGKAWGGPCFKKDTVAFKRWLEDVTGRRAKIVGCNIEINDEMKEKFGMRE